MRHSKLLPVAVTLLGIAGLAAAASPASPEIGERVRAVLEEGGFQTELPRAPSEPLWESGGDSRSASRDGEGFIRAPREPADPGGIDWTAPVGLGGVLAQAFAWVVVGAVLVVLLLAAGDAWRRRRQRGFELEHETAVGPAPAANGDDAGARDLEALVQAGRWAEAMHLLLQLAIRQLEHRLRREVPPNLTSREVLREVEPAARAPLATLVEAVELSHFGGLPTTREDYRRCAEAYEQVGARG